MKYLGETLDIHTGGIDPGLSASRKRNRAKAKARPASHSLGYWLHAEHLLVEGEKMSKSQGNFFTLRDLFAKGYKPSGSAVCPCQCSLPKQLNFTFDGLQQAASSVERLRNFADRLKRGKISRRKQEGMAARIQKRRRSLTPAFDDLNTGAGRLPLCSSGARSEYCHHKGRIRQGDVQAVLDFLAAFDISLRRRGRQRRPRETSRRWIRGGEGGPRRGDRQAGRGDATPRRKSATSPLPDASARSGGS